MEGLWEEAREATARPAMSRASSSVLLFVLWDGGEQPSSRRVTFQQSGFSNWSEEPGEFRNAVVGQRRCKPNT